MNELMTLQTELFDVLAEINRIKTDIAFYEKEKDKDESFLTELGLELFTAQNRRMRLEKTINRMSPKKCFA